MTRAQGSQPDLHPEAVKAIYGDQPPGPTFSEAEVKELTETATDLGRRIGRKEAAEEIAEGIEAVRDAVKLFPIENLDDLLTVHDAWTNAAQIARDIGTKETS